MSKQTGKKYAAPKPSPAMESGIWITLRSVGVNNPELDPFVVGDTVKERVEEVLDTQVQKNGDYLIKVRTEEQARRLLSLRKLGNKQKITCERHGSMNTIRCVISHPSIIRMEDETLCKRLGEQGVIAVRSIKPNNKLKILTIKGTVVPKTVRIGLLKVNTTPYYPMARFCRNCWEVGHITDDCMGEARCGNCSGKHEMERCNYAPYCGNCGEEHKPATKECPVIRQEKAITKIQVDLNIAPRKARKIFKKRNHSYIPLPEERPDRGFFNTAAERSEVEESEEEDKDEPVEPVKVKVTPQTGRKRKSAELKPAKSSAKKLQIRSVEEDDFISEADLLSSSQRDD